MKPKFFPRIVVFCITAIPFVNFAQKLVTPCCTIIKVDMNAGSALARDNTSGLTFQFIVGSTNINSLKEGDPVSLKGQSKNMSAITEIGKSYAVLQPKEIQPCCAITDIQTDAFAPCCTLISTQENSTGRQFSFSVPKNIAIGLKTGQPVNFGPIDGYAFVQSNLTGVSGPTSIFSYPITNNVIPFQKNQAAPCCAVIAIDVANGMVLSRDNKTGRTFQFNVNSSELNNLKVGDPVGMNDFSRKIISINGVNKSYTILEPDGIGPCCTILSIQANPAAPCCAILTAQENGTANEFSFSVPKNLATGLKIGQPVSFGPIDAFAFLQRLSSGNNFTTYSYPIDNGPSLSSNDTSVGRKFEMNPNSTLRGATGRVYINLPSDVECFIYIYAHGSDAQVAGTSRDRAFFLMPGSYDIKVSSSFLEEIIVKKGMDTRIKAGVLSIVSPSAWALYDESKKNRITGASKAMKIGLPVGNYQLQMSGTFIPVMIRDGKKEDF